VDKTKAEASLIRTGKHGGTDWRSLMAKAPVVVALAISFSQRAMPRATWCEWGALDHLFLFREKRYRAIRWGGSERPHWGQR
jgi:hypothetical protein